MACFTRAVHSKHYRRQRFSAQTKPPCMGFCNSPAGSDAITPDQSNLTMLCYFYGCYHAEMLDLADIQPPVTRLNELTHPSVRISNWQYQLFANLFLRRTFWSWPCVPYTARDTRHQVYKSSTPTTDDPAVVVVHMQGTSGVSIQDFWIKARVFYIT